ncbi:hypothetical protein M514_12659 [Trichuris suis]|uniref:Uncharacterized protein n=1 Tax=Trichuris suis TaxID=68888 RepID=A0A085MTR7_9BILA|nr:hypothetical protein M513_12659 [Trichuris suis]KFD60613.1 hypothetical protein M514_12659 [Trichuris suis]
MLRDCGGRNSNGILLFRMSNLVWPLAGHLWNRKNSVWFKELTRLGGSATNIAVKVGRSVSHVLTFRKLMLLEFRDSIWPLRGTPPLRGSRLPTAVSKARALFAFGVHW